MKCIGLLLVLLLACALAGCQRTAGMTVTPSVITTAILKSTETPFLPPTFTPLPPTFTPKPPLVLKKGPYLLFNGKPDGMTVMWQSETPCTFMFDWGLDESYTLGSSVPQEDPTSILYHVALIGLQPGTRYFYRISTANAAIHGSFVTSPSTSDSLTFFAYGDSRSGPEIHEEIAASILQQIAADPSAQTFVISTGDLMDIATEESLQENEFSTGTPNIREEMATLPIVNIMGNHDGTALFKRYFPYPFTQTYDWSFDYGPAHFTIIDQYIELVPGSERWLWLKNDLASTSKPWKFILLHEPGWSAGHHDNNEMVQTIIQPLAVANGVQMIIAGHNHYYARAQVEGVTHITTGGGGAPLYDTENGWPHVVVKLKAFHYIKFTIHEDVLTAWVLSPQGDLLDTFSLAQKETK